MNWLKVTKVARVILRIGWYLGTIYTVAILLYHYQSNMDSSQSELKQFNQITTGRYPSFTFCIYAGEGKLFKGEKLRREYGLSKREYYDFLAGNLNDKNLTTLKIEFNKVVPGIEDVLEEFEVENDAYQSYNEWTPAMKNISRLFLDSSYQDPTTNCFTYNTQFDNTVSLHALKIKFNTTKFQRLFDQAGKLYVLAHYPGIMIRDMRTFLMKIRNWHNLKPANGNNQMKIQFIGITLMRFRENAVDPCDPTLIDDDSAWREYVDKQIGCIPPYWNNITTGRSNQKSLNSCTSQNMLSKLKEFWPIFGEIRATEAFKHYKKPCNKMIIYHNVHNMGYEKFDDILKIKLEIREDFYQEILNTRAFGMDNLWANIGGYVGIFCGYSLLQVTNHFLDIMKKYMINTTK